MCLCFRRPKRKAIPAIRCCLRTRDAMLHWRAGRRIPWRQRFERRCRQRGAGGRSDEVGRPSHSSTTRPAPARSRAGAPGAPPAALLAIVLALLCVASWVHQDHYDFQTDDAYISYRYAHNWALGAGPVFNRGERVEGYTNFLLVAFLALVRRLGGDIVVASRTLGTLSCWGLIAAMFWMMRSQLGRSPAFALAGAAALALHAALSTWARSGLETLPLAFLVLLAQILFLHEHRHQRHHWRSALVFAAVALLRADGLLFLGGAVVFLLLRRQPPRALASLVLPFLGVLLPYFCWRWNYDGWLLPNTTMSRRAVTSTSWFAGSPTSTSS